MQKLLAFTMFAAVSSLYAAAPKNGSVADVWNYGKMAGESTNSAQVIDGRADNVRMQNVSHPTLEFFLVKSDKPRGVVVVCPGGGYRVLMYDHEGTKIAEALNEEGISAVVLKYRVPENRDGALMDIQRAIRLIRANAADWNINPDKIAVMGFSAGANLCARASTLYADNSYKPTDAADNLSARPDMACVIYPAYCAEPSRSHLILHKPKADSVDYNTDYELAKDLKVDAKTPPTFIMQTQKDQYVDNSIAYYLALKKAKVPTQLHLFDEGAHGVGVNKTDMLVGAWKSLCAKWLKSNGINQ